MLPRFMRPPFSGGTFWRAPAGPDGFYRGLPLLVPNKVSGCQCAFAQRSLAAGSTGQIVLRQSSATRCQFDRLAHLYLLSKIPPLSLTAISSAVGRPVRRFVAETVTSYKVLGSGKVLY